MRKSNVRVDRASRQAMLFARSVGCGQGMRRVAGPNPSAPPDSVAAIRDYLR
ncbi:hypothetical protein INH39_31460 [Massilia violaceinigra]|uniref:Uncharacterized protein n=1 Tax=Massilia violaceinigra TaxID=2045208 RepID=A0ABY4A4Y4_9BURK|nr:hypothetical protein [Massilia violaceinigra]UOD29838.1 hypothetical protein INH39_31460 [Massilia violaceinigra]